MAVPDTSQGLLLRAVELFDSRVLATPTSAWTSPSPCEGWTARDVVSHCVGNLRALRSAVEGADFLASSGQPVDGDIVVAWEQVRESAPRLAAEAGAMTTLTVGTNAVPPVAVVDGLMRDLVIHAWDLARAAGGDDRLPADLVDAATRAMAMVGPEARGPGLYGEEVPVPEDADPQTRLLGLAGRRVR